MVENLNSNDSISVRPFWEEIAYIGEASEGISSSRNLHLPKPYSTSPYLIAFYSFKGGVGKTIHLAAHLFSLLECSRELEKPIKVLVIDADLEAPGLTYSDRMEKQQPAVSFIDFLETYHYSLLPIDQTLSLFAKEIEKSPKHEGRSIFYFLPACLNDEQLLDTPVLPEHLVRSSEGEWTVSNAIYQLGQALEVDYVLVYLRAGLSEISSPLIFDPRIQRIFITTATEQSVAGLSLVLEQISRIAPSDTDVKLAYWVCSQAKVIEAVETEIDDLSREEFVSKLEKLWGEKLGGVNKAYTASWVFAALTDFKGRLQARDIVRLLYHAAVITVERSKKIQFERWSTNRLLPTQSIRRALEPCNEKKVKEAQEEYPEFKKWVDKIEIEYTQDQKHIPFTVEDLNLDQITIRMLEDMGVIYEDRAKDDVARYYMPEIFCTGLKFVLEKGARPRVLVLKRKALGIGVL